MLYELRRYVFVFQAEDGIRDRNVTGVQTCALPISKKALAMSLCRAVAPNRKAFFVADNCHPQTIAVVQTRAKPLGIDIKIGDYSHFKFDDTVFGALVQYPATDGGIYDYSEFVKQAHNAGALVVVAADILALTLLKPPGEFGADVAVGSTQRFGVPLGFGGPHAAYFATRDQHKR